MDSSNLHDPGVKTEKNSKPRSMSARNRSASVLFEKGIISPHQMNVLKDLIMCGDEVADKALESYDHGDERPLLDLLGNKYRQMQKSTFTYLDDNVSFEALDMIPYDEVLRGRADTRANSLIGGKSDPHKVEFHRKPAPSVDNPGFGYSSTFISGLSAESIAAGFSELSPTFGNFFDVPSSEAELHENTNSRASLGSLPSSSNQILERMQEFENGDSGHMSLYEEVETRLILDKGDIGPIDNKAETGKRFIGKYSPEARKKRIEKFIEKRQQRIWTKRVKYDMRKNYADSRLRVKGRFVKKEDEELLREFMNLS